MRNIRQFPTSEEIFTNGTFANSANDNTILVLFEKREKEGRSTDDESRRNERGGETE